MALRLEIDRCIRGTRKRLFTTIPKSKLRCREMPGATLPFPQASRIHVVPWWFRALRPFCLIVLPICYVLTTFFHTPSSNARRVIQAGYGGKAYIPLLDTQVTRREKRSSVVQSIAVVAACKDRHALLRQVVPSWLGLKSVREVVIVDWTSSPPLANAINPVLDDERIRLVRVEGEKRWVLSRAFNLGVSLAQSEWIVRLDCDYRVAKGFVASHLGMGGNDTTLTDPSPPGFWAGRWQQARDENEVHLKGALIVKRSDFLQAGGYDERIQTYGWDDEDLFARLQSLRLKKYTLEYDLIDHVPHAYDVVSHNGILSPELNVEFNSLLLKRLPAWSGASTPRVATNGSLQTYETILQLSSYERVYKKHALDRELTLHTLSTPPAVSELVDSMERDQDWNSALGHILHDTYGLCWDLMAYMDTVQRERLLQKLLTTGDGAKDPDEVPRFLAVHVMHGLGNRLRALASALAFAKNTGRVPIVIWESDSHCQAKFTDLFETQLSDNGFIVAVDSIAISWPFGSAAQYDSAWDRWETFNYMQQEGSGAKKDELILGNLTKSIYFKGAYIMQARPWSLTGWDVANEQLRKLRAVKSIRDVVENVEQELSESIGVHIRHLNTQKDIAAVNAHTEYGAQDTVVIDYWRNASSPLSFVDGVKEVLAEYSDRRSEAPKRIFMATDSAEWVEEVERHLPGMTWTLSGADDGLGCSDNPKTHGDRSAGCLRRALADLLCLSRTRLVLGSMWSSFSEASSRFGAGELRLSGVDFGAASKESVESIAARYGAEVADLVANVRRKRGMRKKKQTGNAGK